MIKLRDIIAESIDLDNFKVLVSKYLENNSAPRAQTRTELLDAFRLIKSHKEKQAAVKLLIKFDLLNQIRAAA
jgi:hypothetical protein